ncbi:hypothetical protein [Trichormus azollae]|uniref:hypothetical protein n=1 Tax=Trichormus azollae TaxID=1164 RepID=UPI00325D7CDA
MKDKHLTELIDQAEGNLHAAQANPVNASPPQIVFHFSEGVTPEVAPKVRAVNVNGQHLIVKGKEIPLPP